VIGVFQQPEPCPARLPESDVHAAGFAMSIGGMRPSEPFRGGATGWDARREARALRLLKKWRCRRHCCHSIVAGTTAVVPARFVSHLRVANRLRRLCPLGDGELFKFYLKSSVCQRQTGLPKGNPPCAFPTVPAGVLGRREGAGIQWMQLPKAVSD